VQLKHFYKDNLMEHILHSQTNNGGALVPEAETSFGNAGKFLPAFLVGSVADPDPDPKDPHVFGPPGSGSGSTSQRYGSGSGSFLPSCKTRKKNLDSYCYVTSFRLFIFEK
jgi:hypothetical protein